jgi:phage terminase large subunit-like protein
MDISKLSREEKLELIALLEEKKRRDKEKRPVFKNGAHAKQLEVLASTEIERWVLAGNGSGKTATGAEDTRCHVLGVNPYNNLKTQVPCRAYIILDKPEKIDQVVLPELRKWMNIPPENCHKKGKPYVSEISFDNGSWIKFLFWDQDPMTAEGFEGDYFWFDEPPPKHLYIALKRAGRTKGRPARYLITCTLLKSAWIRIEVLEPWQKGERPHTACFEFETEMNRKNLREGWIEEFSAVLSEKEKLVRLKGKSFDLDGVALAHLFRRSTHTINRKDLDWDRNNPTVIVIDPHPSKAHHAIVLGVDRDNYLYVLEEYKEKAVARKFIKSLIGKGWFSKYRIMDIVYDSLGNSEMTSGEGFKPFGTVINEVLQQHGLGRARATTFEEKSDEAFIERIQDSLLLPETPNSFGQIVPKLRVVSDCIGTIGNIENVQWAKNRNTDENKPSLDISNQDFLSCLKYGLATNLYHSKTKDKVYYYNKPAYGFDVTPKQRGKIKIARKRYI